MNIKYVLRTLELPSDLPAWQAALLAEIDTKTSEGIRWDQTALAAEALSIERISTPVVAGRHCEAAPSTLLP